MKFCKYCGAQIADDAECSCPAAVAERQAQNSYPQQPAYGQQQAYVPPQKPPREGKNFGQKLIEPFTLYFKNPKQAVDNRIKDKDFVTSLIYIATLFIVMLGVKCCIYGTESVKGRPYINYNFGLALLAAFIATIALCTAYVMSRFIILIVCGKKPVNGGELMLNSLISFGVNSIVPMGLILVGGLFYMATSMLAYMFFAVAVVWYLVAGLLEIKDDFNPDGNPFVRLLITALIIGTFVALYFLLYRGLYVMNVKAVLVSTTYNTWSPYVYY